MASPPSLEKLFGAGTTQDIDALHINKHSLQSRKTPPDPNFVALIAAANNAADQLFVAMMLTALEGQDSSSDAFVQIFGPQLDMVQVPVAGVQTYKKRYRFTVDIYNDLGNLYPNPNGVS